MPFSMPLIVECPLPASVTRARVRAFSTSRHVPVLEAYRRRQIVGWRLSRSNEEFLFQPEYGDALDVQGARFIGLVEPFGSGSRIRGQVVAAPLMRILASVLMLAVALAVTAALAQRREPATKVLTIGALMLGAMVMMMQYSLRSTSRLVEARLRQCLEVAGPRAAA
jgi:ABC-type multidrug transport system fused ATPase/permease subunit